MNKQQMLLTILMEECNETSQRASKAIRFGLEEIQEGQNLTNAERLVYEFNDILACMELLFAEKHIPYHIDPVESGLKKVKIEKWLKYSKECGTITD